MAPYVTGFDTMAHYVPTTLVWLNGGIDFWGFMATAPLFYSIVILLVSSGSTVITALKVLPPILHGFLSLSIYGYARKGLDWSLRKSLLSALLATLYFVSLRISWDMQRNQLALILFFILLTLLSIQGSNKSWKRYLLISLVMSLVVLAHQLISVIMFGVIGFTIAYMIRKRKRYETSRLLLVSLPAVFIFLVIFYFSPKISEYRLIFGFSQNDGWLSLFGFSSYGAMLTSVGGFFLFLFLPILPIVIIGFKNLTFQLKAWALLCIIGALIPIVSPSNLRWLMLLVYPFAFCLANALSKLRLVSWKAFRITVHKIVLVYLIIVLIVLSASFLLVPSENPVAYFNANEYNNYAHQIPTSMLQNTVSLADCYDTTNALEWLKSNLNEKDYLLSHRAFYGWALLSISRNQVILYEYNNPGDAAKTISHEGSKIYLIWWTNGQGWYGQPTVPSSFQEVYHSGKIAIYTYTSNN
jgi:hypothetical protein